MANANAIKLQHLAQLAHEGTVVSFEMLMPERKLANGSTSPAKLVYVELDLHEALACARRAQINTSGRATMGSAQAKVVR